MSVHGHGPGVEDGAEDGAVSPLLTLVLLVLAVVLVASPLLFVSPAEDDAAAIAAEGPVDAVVVLGGSPSVRLAAAVDIVEALPDPPRTLVLSVQYPAPVLSCGTVPALPAVPVSCFSPEPATTSGEAAWIAGEAAARGWDHVVVVTSDTHLTRARLLVEQCVGVLAPDTGVSYVAADTPVASIRGVWSIATEWPSLLGAPLDHQPVCR